ncbi:MAG: D-glycero-alpha-D-manno-heptose-1,7-bisphosphate 7-phosphatase [Planctomycetota bacterium]
MKRPAVFLDRDGTLNAERDFLRSVDELEVLPGVLNSLQRLHAAGFLLIVLTNQSGIARGFYGETELARIHEELQRRLAGLPRAYLHCPHLPDLPGSPYGRNCSCRKPADGLLQQAIKLYEPDLAASFVVGDSARDLMTIADRPLHGILLKSGKPWQDELAKLEQAGCPPELVAADMTEACDHILRSRD